MAVTDEMLMAYADGELDAAARAEVEAALAGDPALRARLEAEQRLRARLAGRYGPVAEEPVPERLAAMLESNKVVDLSAARAARVRPVWQSFAVLAATLVLGVLLGRGLPEGGPIVVEDGRMIAHGELAEALESQLASAQAANAPTRIGVSFAGTDGRWCRSFERADLSGIACHDDANWQLVMTAPGTTPQGTEYRQASSGTALVMEAAGNMMADAPLDAEAERRMRDRGWRE